MNIKSRFFIVPALVASLQAASGADITGTVTLSGTPPANPAVDMSSVAECAKQHSDPVTMPLYSVGPKQELADVVVYLKGIKGKSTGESAEPLVLDQRGCQYIPYVSAAQTGQKILVKNSEPSPLLMHNVHAIPAAEGNGEKNLAGAPGGPPIAFTFPTEEKFLRFKCDIHGWMFAYVTVLDSPYFSVTDKEGKFKISNVPPGKYTVEALHRKAGKVDKEIEVKDASVPLDFTLEVPK